MITAPPGAGKTTRIPPALLDAGRVILLLPRRVAVRSIASRIAYERGWTLGREIGWQIRFDRRFTPATQLLVVTEGILTARLQSDPTNARLQQKLAVVIAEYEAISARNGGYRIEDPQSAEPDRGTGGTGPTPPANCVPINTSTANTTLHVVMP